MIDLVIHNGRIVHPDSIVEASIAIRDGRIVAIGAPDTMPAATETIWTGRWCRTTRRCSPDPRFH
jgi:urease alpha subunit